jgi:hypothetical protein
MKFLITFLFCLAPLVSWAAGTYRNDTIEARQSLRSLGTATIGSSASLGSDAILDIASTTKGSVPCPKMSATQRNAISSPRAGLCVFNTDTNQLNNYNGSGWDAIAGTSTANTVRTPLTAQQTINAVTTATGTYAALVTDETIVGNSAGGDVTVTLPAAAGVAGKKYHVLTGSNSNKTIIDPSGSETVCGQTTVSVRGTNDAITIQSDGSKWVGLNDSCQVSRRLTVWPNCTGSPCTVAKEGVPWVSSVTRSATGTYTVNVNAGVFSSAPSCIVGNATSSVSGIALIEDSGITTTAFGVVYKTSTTGANTDGSFVAVCMGQR